MSTLAPVIAQNVKTRREQAGMTQDQLAARLQERGLQWGRNSVAWLESKKREPTVSEFIFLAAALNIRPAELLEVPEDLRVPGGLTKDQKGDMVSVGLAEVPAEVLPGLLYGRGYKHLTAAWEPGMSASEAEKVVAAKLGLTEEQVQDLAFGLWGRRLDNERDERAGHPTGPGAPMKKAHVTRKLRTELEADARKRGWLADDNQGRTSGKERQS